MELQYFYPTYHQVLIGLPLVTHFSLECSISLGLAVFDVPVTVLVPVEHVYLGLVLKV
jgi:hypothetical protein